MVSALEPGTIKIFCDRKGTLLPLFQADSIGPIAAGGSPDGVLANLTIDKQLQCPTNRNTLYPGDVIRLFFLPRAADGYDVSDCVCMVPIREDGNSKTLTFTEFGATTDIPAATVALQHFEFGTGYTIPNNVRSAQFGGGPIVISINDDTA